jgi:hypothetical protein
MIHVRTLLAAAALTAAAIMPARAEPATLLGVFQSWSAYSSGSGSDMTCYALTQPRASTPKTAKRSAVYLMVSDWPGRKVRAEPQLVLGYDVKTDAAASLAVGPTKFEFFARTTGKDGSAWLKSVNDNGRLIEVMSKGISAVATGASARGTKTTDTYTLAGFDDALAKVHAVCNM